MHSAQVDLREPPLGPPRSQVKFPARSGDIRMHGSRAHQVPIDHPFQGVRNGQVHQAGGTTSGLPA